MRILQFLALAAILQAPLLLAQEPSAYIAPRTEHGVPDLQGVYEKNFSMSMSPLQRPRELGERRAYTQEEAAEIEAQAALLRDAYVAPLEADRGAPPRGGIIEFNTDINFQIESYSTNLVTINGEKRTSLIIEPDDGRLPYREGILEARRRPVSVRVFDGPEVRPLGERCIHLGPPIPYMDNFDGIQIQIVQTRDYVFILSEEAIQYRIIPLNREHLEHPTPRWMGNSVGHWEGETLVIHSKNFRPEQTRSSIAMSESFEVTERISALSENEILYRYTFVDPEVYSEPVTAEMTFGRMTENHRLYESECHEGNYALTGILAGARRQELDLEMAVNR